LYDSFSFLSTGLLQLTVEGLVVGPVNDVPVPQVFLSMFQIFLKVFLKSQVAFPVLSALCDFCSLEGALPLDLSLEEGLVVLLIRYFLLLVRKLFLV
jgi:hypothetical protein